MAPLQPAWLHSPDAAPSCGSGDRLLRRTHRGLPPGVLHTARGLDRMGAAHSGSLNAGRSCDRPGMGRSIGARDQCRALGAPSRRRCRVRPLGTSRLSPGASGSQHRSDCRRRSSARRLCQGFHWIRLAGGVLPRSTIDGSAPQSACSSKSCLRRSRGRPPRAIGACTAARTLDSRWWPSPRSRRERWLRPPSASAPPPRSPAIPSSEPRSHANDFSGIATRAGRERKHATELRPACVRA
jgi:hypothetical protein